MNAILHRCLILAVAVFGCAGLLVAGEDGLERFKQASREMRYDRMLSLGAGVLAAHPDDAIIRVQYADALFAAGRFREVLTLAATDPFIPTFPDLFAKVDDLGFYFCNWQLWRMKVLAHAGLGEIDAALAELDRMRKFEDRPMLFLECLLLRCKGEADKAASLEAKWFPLPYRGEVEGELFARRLLPLLRGEAQLDDLLAGSTGTAEDEMLRAVDCCRKLLTTKDPAALASLEDLVAKSCPAGDLRLPRVLLGLFGDGRRLAEACASSIGDPRWWQINRLSTEYVEAFHVDGDFPTAAAKLKELRRLQPRETDYGLGLAIIHIAEGDWQAAIESIDTSLERNPWNSENTVCAKLYRILLHRLLNRQPDAARLQTALTGEEIIEPWRDILAMMNQPARFDALRAKFKDQSNYLDVVLFVRALMAETDGDYLLAEQLYLDLVADQAFARYLEPIAANRRLDIVSPLAAVQELGAAPRSSRSALDTGQTNWTEFQLAQARRKALRKEP